MTSDADPLAPPKCGARLEAAFHAAFTDAEQRRQESCTLEHLLHALLAAGPVREILVACGADADELTRELRDYIDLLPELPSTSTKRPSHDPSVYKALGLAAFFARSAGRSQIDEPDVLAALLRQPDAYAALLIAAQGVTRVDVLRRIAHGSDATAFTIAPATSGSPLTVVLHNDPFTTMEFVVTVLSSVFDLSEARAKELMLEVHHKGSGRIGVMPAEQAAERATRTMRLAEESDYPLRLTVEPA